MSKPITPTKPKKLPPPGRKLSFQEAKAAAIKQYKNALAKLAK
jgi:hypothetical protein